MTFKGKLDASAQGIRLPYENSLRLASDGFQQFLCCQESGRRSPTTLGGGMVMRELILAVRF